MEEEYMSEGTALQTSDRQTIWICRHGNRIDFVDRSWKGTDPHLSSDGVVQAKETGIRLRHEEIQHIFASPFSRTVETAFHIAEALDLSVKIEQGACEWLNPEWFSASPPYVSPGDLAKSFHRVDVNHATLVRPQYPETWEECMARCQKTIGLLSDTYRANILVIGHGASVLGLTRGLLEHEHDISAGLCALTKVSRRDGQWSLELNGDASHLSGGKRYPDQFH
jgi:broad specificity phosphatase PhoE